MGSDGWRKFRNDFETGKGCRGMDSMGDMEQDFRIENVIANIKGKIAASGISVADQYLALPYYKKMMAEFRKQNEIVIVGSGVYGLRLYEMLEWRELSGESELSVTIVWKDRN